MISNNHFQDEAVGNILLRNLIRYPNRMICKAIEKLK